jgi:hypothetical protein
MSAATRGRTRSAAPHRRFWRTATVLPAVATAVLSIGAAAVISGSGDSIGLTSYANGAPIGAVSRAVQVPGGFEVHGWDFDYDSPKTPLWTFAKVDGTRVGRVKADAARAFLTQDHPRAGKYHGFAWTIPVPEGQHKVCVAASSVGKGGAARLGCWTHDFDYGPFGHIDEVDTVPGHLHIKGWTIDADDPTQALTTTISVDGYDNTVTADQPRPDIVARHPHAGPDHGFELTVPATQGQHQVCVTVTNIGYGSNNSLGCANVTLDDSPIGGVDAVQQAGDKVLVRGWAFDPDRPKKALQVSLRVDKNTPTTLTADLSRPDVADAHPVAGPDHGFATKLKLAEGTHSVCIRVANVGYGRALSLGCHKVTLDFTPTAALVTARATHTGAWVTGWASDPDTSDPIHVKLRVDKKLVDTLTASGNLTGHAGHGFATALPVTSGKHTICAIGINVDYGTHNSTPACKTLTFAFSPLGSYGNLRRTPTGVHIRGWAFDPDTTAPISVGVTLDGKAVDPVRADVPRAVVARRYPRFGSKHGIGATIPADDGEHTVCLTATNVNGGADTSLGCKTIDAVDPVVPTAPQNVQATSGYDSATVTWQPPASDGGAPETGYVVTATPGGASVTVDGDTTTATVSGLRGNAKYTFAVAATNIAGTGPAATSNQVTTQTGPPPQRTPAPVSTSRYIRNIVNGSTSEQAMMRAEGYKDAQANPSNHAYLILLDIGGQDQYDGGVVLSAGVRFVTYGVLEKDLRAYVDGYHSGQRGNAPVVIAAGTNNDMSVSAQTGKDWATKVVGPLRRHAASYSGMTIAGANDIEPGFRAGYAATSAWLSGYLSATKAPFVFNGSADGCAWTTTNGHCNNGWTMTDLYHLAAGAAPTRLINLPQIYNNTMAAQWKYISLTGISHGQPRIRFGGPLTEWTACEQAGSCGSLTGHSAWSVLWSDLQSDPRLKVGSLPYSTDLRIDR